MSLCSRLRATFGREKLDAEVEEELRSHLEMRAADHRAAGMDEEEARYAAQRQFGNTTRMNEETRERDVIEWLDTFRNDVRYALRGMRKNPGFAAVAILTLALGIGANTAFFSVFNAVLLNPLPYPRPNELVTLGESKQNFLNGSISYSNFFDWQKDNQVFSSMGLAREMGFSLTGLGDAEQLPTKLISSDYFSMLGVNPVLGRNFAPEEDRIGAAPVVMLGAGFWKRKFGLARDVLGRTLTLDGKNFTIVGVMREDFDLYNSSRSADIFVPLGQWNHPFLANRAAGLGFHGIGRLKLGMSIEQARADMQRVTDNLAKVYPDADKGIGAHLTPFRQALFGQIESMLMVLFGAVGFVLLIACFNVASLMLARSTGRTREFAVRAALGASKGQLIRQILTESVLLSMVGGAVGLLMAVWAVSAAIRMLPVGLPRAGEIHLDAHVMIFTAAISVLSGVLFGLAPALKSSDLFLAETLKETGRSNSGVRHRAQSVFVVLEMAMALVLLVGAGLMGRTLMGLWKMDTGFDPRNVSTFSISMPPAMSQASPAAIRAVFRDLRARFAAAPGLQAMSYSWGAIPFGWDDEQLFWMDGQPKPASEDDMNWTLSYVVDPEYLETMRLQVKRGRFLERTDDEKGLPVAVIDEKFAEKYFGGADPVGRRIVLEQGEVKTEIVGVVAHMRQWGLDTDDTEKLHAEIYVPFMQMPDAAMKLAAPGTQVLVRSDGTNPALLESLREINKKMSAEQVIYDPETMESMIGKTLAARRFAMRLLGVFAFAALVLASVGIYGVISYLVGQRTREIGVRVALGAGRGDVLRLVLSSGARLTFLGIGIGVVASLGLTRLMARMLYGVSAADPLTYFGVAVVLAVVAMSACYVPTRRAMRVDPVVALRYE